MSLVSNVGLVSKLINSEEFRDAYVNEHLKSGISYQIRATREQNGWTQSDLGEAAKKPRNVISRLEDPTYGQFTLQTLRELASAFGVALLVKFVPFSKLLEEYEDVSPEALAARSIRDPREVRRLKRWAAAKDRARLTKDVKETPARTFRLSTNNVVGANMLFLDKPREDQGPSRKAPAAQTVIETVTTPARVYQFPIRKAS